MSISRPAGRRGCAAAILLGFAAPAGVAAQSSPPAAQQVSAAVLAAPRDRREGATVMGWDGGGGFVTLRKGSNDMICLADDPTHEGFEVNCYHESLEPYMARGRELAAQGVKDRNTPRWEEAKAGKLKLPERPAMLYTLSGDAWDAATGKVTNEYRRSTMYVPYATAESTGLSTQGSTTDPWIMNPGTAGAHIMITPPRKSGG
jgi:hypothetical protein